ncbi:MAG: hypothetical protein Nk1A_9180 [Endomicrobiia bacterium]|nr:MAG: hypothetical protein Nk1A_9180 [Endomicrobiia bacterium]
MQPRLYQEDQFVFYKYMKPGFIYDVEIYKHIDNRVELLDSYKMKSQEFIGFESEETIKAGIIKNISLFAPEQKFIENGKNIVSL